MAELTREELIEKKAFSAPLELADNFSKLHKEILSVIETGKVLNKEFGAAKGLKEISTTTKKLSTNQSELEKVEKRLTTAVEKNNREYIKKAAELKRVQQQTRDSIKTEGQLSNTYDSQSTRLKNLRKEYKDAVLIKGQDAKETQQLAKRVQILDKRLKEVDASAGEFNREVGNYKNKVQEALSETNVFGVNLGDLAGNFSKLVNPVTAAVGVIGALGAAYLSTGRGARDMQRAMDRLNFQMNAFSNAVADVLDLGGDFGIIESFFRQVEMSLLGIGAVIKSDINAAARDTIRELEIQEMKAQEINKRLLNQAEIQRQIRDEERNSIEERFQANTKLNEIIDEREKLQKEIFQEQREAVTLALIGSVSQKEQEILATMKDQEEITERLLSNRNADVALRQQLISIIAEISDIEEDSQGQRSEAMANDLALFREMNEDQLRVTIARIEEQILLAEKGTKKEYSLKLKLINEQEKVLLEAVGENELRKTAVIQEAVNQRIALLKEYEKESTKIITDSVVNVDAQIDAMGNMIEGLAESYDISAEAAEESERRRKEASDAAFEAIADNLEKEAEKRRRLEEQKKEAAEETLILGIDITNQLFNVQRQNIQNELDLLRGATEEKLRLAEGNEEGQQLIRERAAEQEKKLRQEQAVNERRQTIFGIIANTALAIMKVGAQLGVAAPPVQIGLALLGAAQLAAVPPVPQFAKGTKSSPEGYAIINEEGGELLERNGKYSMVESDGAALTYLKQGTRVHTAEETQELLAKGAVKNVAINDRQSNNRLDGMIYSELKKINKGVNQVKSFNSYLDGKVISANVRKRNAMLNKVKSMNRY